MPINIKKNQLYFKDPVSGTYEGIDVVADKTTEERITEINAAGTTQVGLVNAAGATTISAVQTAVTNAQAAVSAAETAVNGIEVQRDTIIAAIASVAGQGTDTTLTQSGVAADAKATGDELGSVSSALNSLDSAVEHYIPFEPSAWDVGRFSDSAGQYINGTKCLRTKEYLDKDIKMLKVATGYRFCIVVWSNGVYQGKVNGTSFSKNSVYTWYTSEASVEWLSDYDIKIVLNTTDDSVISKSAVSNLFYKAATDKTLKNKAVAADAKAAGDEIAYQTGKALRNIPNETITSTLATTQKSYWSVTNDVVSLATASVVNDRASSVQVAPHDEITISFVPNNTYYALFIVDESYNVLYSLAWPSSNISDRQEYNLIAPANSAYLLVNSYGSTNAVTVTIKRYYETGKKSELVTAQGDIELLQKHHDSEFVMASDTSNLFPFKNWAEGSVDPSTGAFTPTAPATNKWIVTDYIPVRPGTTYYTPIHIVGYYYYKDDFTYVSGESGSLANYWQQFTAPVGATLLRLTVYIGNSYTNYDTVDDYLKATHDLHEYGYVTTGVQPTYQKRMHSVYAFDDIFHSNLLKGKTIAVMGDSIGTRLGYNDPEILIGADDVGVELSAYLTSVDVNNGLSIAGHTYTSEEIGEEVTFTPTSDDIGKSIGTPLNHGAAADVRWWQMVCERFGMKAINASFSGSTMVSQESNTTTTYKASCAWHEATIRRCGIRVAGSMTRLAPDYIFIHRGVNDFSKTHSGRVAVLTDGLFDSYDYSMPETDVLTIDNTTKYGFKEAYAMTIQKLRDAYPTAVIICCTITPFRRNSESHFPPNNDIYALPQFNAAIREVADYYGCPVCDFDKLYSYEQLSVFTGDNTHPNEKGHRIMANKAITTLINYVKNT